MRRQLHTAAEEATLHYEFMRPLLVQRQLTTDCWWVDNFALSVSDETTPDLNINPNSISERTTPYINYSLSSSLYFTCKNQQKNPHVHLDVKLYFHLGLF